MAIRTRIAPSPTGPPHVGTAYVAIFNLAFARQQGGQFILRIEDTDRTRSEPRWETMIFDSLRWLGLDWDEGPDVGGPYGPYRQSERTEIYVKHAQILLDRGRAYRCFCTAERLTQVRDAQKAARQDFKYDRYCRGMDAAEEKRLLDAATPYVIRQAIPLDGETTVQDLIRGPITIQNSVPDDQILIKSDGFPTYHLASVVDDQLMQITHVMRAEEWINSTPKHLLLYQDFGWAPPQFAHLPLLRNADRTKISKRKNPVSVPWYREEGYLPPAMVNFLALMGYSMPEGREIFGFEDIQDSFDFKRINPAGPIFDLEKLAWLNGTYIREMSDEALTASLRTFGVSDDKLQRIGDMLPLVRERMRKLKDFEEICDYFFTDSVSLEPSQLVPKKRTAAETAPVLRSFADRLESLEAPWDKERLEAAMRALTEELGWPARDSFMAVRVAVTGRTNTPPLIESIAVLGRDRSVQRLREAADALPGLMRFARFRLLLKVAQRAHFAADKGPALRRGLVRALRPCVGDGLPLPFVFGPPTDERDWYFAGETWIASLVLIGPAIEKIGCVIDALGVLWRGGGGPQGARIILEQVDVLDPRDHGYQSYFFTKERVVKSRIVPFDDAQIEARARLLEGRRKITVAFQSPPRLSAAFLTDLSTRIARFPETGEWHRGLASAHVTHRWHSPHELILEGELDPWFPPLVLGQHLGVGNGAAVGFGRYELRP